MALEFTVARGAPTNEFWENFAELWQNSLDRSPFKSPHILRYFAGATKDKTTVFQCFENAQLRGVVFLKENAGVYTFLSDLKTDVNFFVLDRKLSREEQKQFFEGFLQTVKRESWMVILNNQPAWAGYMPIFEEAGKNSDLFWLNISYSVCPFIEAETPEALFEQVNSSRELRYRMNKLKKQENAEFEVLTDGTELELWVKEFCEAHVLRWADTSTPSAFRDPARRQFLFDCLKAWNADNLLVRFAVKVEQRRIGFVVGLLEEHSLIHHSTTFHPDYWKFSPGKALILFMTQWMKDHNMRILDFGDGNEPYKYDVANQEHVLNRIFISGKSKITFMMKAGMIKFIRNNQKAYNLYQNRLKPWAAGLHLPHELTLLLS
jgi:hypothetical protein